MFSRERSDALLYGKHCFVPVEAMTYNCLCCVVLLCCVCVFISSKICKGKAGELEGKIRGKKRKKKRRGEEKEKGWNKSSLCV